MTMISLIFAFQLLSQICLAQQLDITIGENSRSFALTDLKKKLKEVRVTNLDPVYKVKKTFVGFKLKDLIELAGPIPTELDEVSFIAKDGYAPSMGVSELSLQNGILAYRESSRASGFPVYLSPGKKISFEPFYLVWENEEKVPENYPRPYQLVRIEFKKFTEKFKGMYPKEIEGNSAVKKGFTVYRGLCFRCHSINGLGGSLGPELNSPNNITEYWHKSALKKFIKGPAAFRANSKMPDVPLSDEDIDQVLAYLEFMKSYKNVR